MVPEARKARLIGGQLTLSLFLLAVVFLPSAVAQVKETRRVLIFNDFGSISSPGIGAMDQAILTGLEKSPYQIELYNENLEVTLFPDEASQREFRRQYIRTYLSRKPDVIITVGPTSLKLMVEMHEGSLGNVPTVFCGVPEGLVDELKLDARFTGVWAKMQPEKTLDVALRLQPNTKHLVVTGGTGRLDRELEAIVKEGFRNYESKLDITYLTDLSMPTLLERLRHLPSDTIVYHTAITQDAAGERFIDATQAVPMVASAANAPVFAVDDVDVGKGTVGGDVLSWAATGRDAAEMAIKVLNGEKPQDIPVLASDNIYLFDWKALHRWGFRERDLPNGSVVLNLQPSFWEVYKRYVIAGVFLLLAQWLVIVGLLRQRAQRRNTQADLARSLNKLRESEERFRLVANTAPVMIWMSGPDKLWTYFNPSWLEFTGRSLEAEIGNGWAEGVHSEDLEQCINLWTTAFDRREPFQMQFRLRCHDGEYRWIFERGVPRFDMDGSFAGYIGACGDITERKLAEEALATMSRKLLEAQEQERKRIARELHDNTNQRLALLAVGIEQLKNAIPYQIPDVRVRMGEIHKQMLEISNDVQDLSHELHSSKLEYFGLVLAMKSFCREFSGKHNVEVAFFSEGMPAVMPPEISLCLFRVMQEGLHNALKHSGVKLFDVKLLGSPTEIRLTVRDLGKGFDPELAKDTPGLGLVSMQERVRHVKGTISITSRPQSGTEINVRVPLSAEAPAEQARSAEA